MPKIDKGQPWNTENWFVSPWNFLPEVTNDFKPPKQVKIHDVTLRDGEQQAGIVFTTDDKIRIAEKLAEAGVHRIEAGMPAVTPQDEAAIKEIVKRNLGPQIFCFSRCMVDDVKRAVDCGVSGVQIEIPVSEHLIKHAYGWPLEKALALPIEATRFAHEQGLYVVFFPMDATRAGMDWYLNVINKIAMEGHMDALTLVDTFGALSPHGASYYTKTVKENIKKPLEIHFHNNFGMASANTVMSVLAGGEVIHSTVNGIGEMSGNCSMVETVMALLSLYGIDVGIDYSKLNELSKLVMDLSGIEIPANRPLVGSKAYTVESGIVTSWYKNAYEKDPTIVFPVNPKFVGHEMPEILMGKKSGVDNVVLWAEKLGLEIAEEQRMPVLNQVKLKSHDLKRTLTEEEFKEIVKRVKAGK